MTLFVNVSNLFATVSILVSKNFAATKASIYVLRFVDVYQRQVLLLVVVVKKYVTLYVNV